MLAEDRPPRGVDLCTPAGAGVAQRGQDVQMTGVACKDEKRINEQQNMLAAGGSQRRRCERETYRKCSDMPSVHDSHQRLLRESGELVNAVVSDAGICSYRGFPFSDFITQQTSFFGATDDV